MQLFVTVRGYKTGGIASIHDTNTLTLSNKNALFQFVRDF